MIVKCSICKEELIPEAEDFEEETDKNGILWKLCPECDSKSELEEESS